MVPDLCPYYKDDRLHPLVRAVKSRSKALQHFKVDPVLKIDESVYKLYKILKILVSSAKKQKQKQKFPL